MAAASRLAGRDPLDGFQHDYANLRSKGLSHQAAEQLAMQSLKTGQAPSESARFRALQGDE
ncbi:MAG: hypothetical protein VKK97_10940 [Synechococcaceae cyanobacterium]|nr:hypothetical protein [Synechococcaceae cyanobacterium]